MLKNDAYIVAYEPERLYVAVAQLKAERCAELPDGGLYYTGDHGDKPTVFKPDNWFMQKSQAIMSAKHLVKDMLSEHEKAVQRLRGYVDGSKPMDLLEGQTGVYGY